MGVKHKEDAPRCGGGKGAASPKTPIGASLKSSAKAMRHFSPPDLESLRYTPTSCTPAGNMVKYRHE